MNGGRPAIGLLESPTPAQMARTHIERARLLMDARRHDLAVNELRGALMVDPDHAEAHALLGYYLSLIDAPNPTTKQEADREAREAVRLEPDNSYIHHMRGMILECLGRPDEALEALQEALRLDPNNVAAHGLVARVERRLGRPARALAAAEAGLAINPEDRVCGENRILTLRALGRRKEAQAAATEMLRQDPDNVTAHAALGWLLVERGRAGALEHFRAALRINPDYAWAQSGLVPALKTRFRSYRLLRSVDGMSELFDLVLWLHPRDRHALAPGAARGSARTLALVFVISAIITFVCVMLP